MSTFTKTLSKKVVSGKSQVLVRANITRKCRPTFKSGIYIKPEHFADGEVIIPKRGKFNVDEIKDAMKSKSEIEAYCSRIDEIILASVHHVKDLNREWILTVMDLDDKGKIHRIDGVITYQSITNAFKQVSSISKKKIFANLSEDLNIYDCIDEYCRLHELADSRVTGYVSAKRILFRFTMFEQMVEGKPGFVFNPETISVEDLTELKSYMLNEGTLVNRFPIVYSKIKESMNLKFPFQRVPRSNVGLENKSENYVIGIMKKLSAVFRWLRESCRVITNDPFAGFEIGTTQYVKRPVYISVDERRMLTNFDLSDDMTLEVQRDIFIFQCLTGCRYGDLQGLKPSNITDGVLEYVAGKSRKYKDPAQPRIPLSKTALALVDRYAGADLQGRLFPFVSMTKYNECLKEIFKKAGLVRNVYVYDTKLNKEVIKPLNEVVSSHLARRTFVGNSYKVTKDPNIVGMMSGHVNGSRAFARYRDIDDEDLREIIDQIDNE